MGRSKMNLHFFSTTMEPFRALDKLDSATMMLDFVRRTESNDLEVFALLLMPRDFATYFLHKRLSTHPKEAFRRAFLYMTGHMVNRQIVKQVHQNGELSKAEVAVIEFVRNHGSFELSQLPIALGHQPTKDEEHNISQFLSAMSDKNWQRLLRDNNINY